MKALSSPQVFTAALILLLLLQSVLIVAYWMNLL